MLSKDNVVLVLGKYPNEQSSGRWAGALGTVARVGPDIVYVRFTGAGPLASDAAHFHADDLAVVGRRPVPLDDRWWEEEEVPCES